MCAWHVWRVRTNKTQHQLQHTHDGRVGELGAGQIRSPVVALSEWRLRDGHQEVMALVGSCYLATVVF